MPKIAENAEMIKLPSSNYGYSRVKKEKLTAAEYTVVTLAVDNSGSVEKFSSEIEKCVKETVRGCLLSPRADNLLIRTVCFANRKREVHGFKLQSEINEADFDGLYQESTKAGIGCMTALYDTCENSVAAMNDFGKGLTKDDYLVNGIFVCITDGLDNESSFGITEVKRRLEESVSSEIMESMISILVAVNVSDPQALSCLNSFHKDAGFTQFIEVKDASAKSLAKLAKFISKSVSSQSQSLGSGGPSKTLVF